MRVCVCQGVGVGVCEGPTVWACVRFVCVIRVCDLVARFRGVPTNQTQGRTLLVMRVDGWANRLGEPRSAHLDSKFAALFRWRHLCPQETRATRPGLEAPSSAGSSGAEPSTTSTW